MTSPAVMPIGIIDRSDDSGGSFMIADPSEAEDISPDTPIVIWNEWHNGAYARYRGYITEVGDRSVAFMITDESIDPGWPPEVDPRDISNPVYLGLPNDTGPGKFMPDMSRRPATREEYHRLMELAELVEEQARVPVSGASVVPTEEWLEDDQAMRLGYNDLTEERMDPVDLGGAVEEYREYREQRERDEREQGEGRQWRQFDPGPGRGMGDQGGYNRRGGRGRRNMR